MSKKKDKEQETVQAEHAPETDTVENTTDTAESQLSEEERLKAALETANERYMRLYAEFDNYKRRTSKERVELMQSAGKEVISNLLTVLDDFDRALRMMEKASDIAPVLEGVELISHKLKKILQQQGLKEMETIGQAFDADFQEAITNIPAPTPEQKGKVIDEVEKGYFLNDKVLRYAKVVVGN